MTPPQSQSAPRIIGAPIVGHPLSVDSGVWYSPTPVTYTYIWHRIPPNKTVGIVTVSTAPTYTPVQADVGLVLAVRVVARNAAGTDNAASDQVGPVVGPPVNVTLPTVTGQPVVDGTLEATDGTWK